ncbi:alpha/beta fold hydrolase [Luteimicrobium sp. DT211]|uniref:alpha/beta fold hydrolase n=1 Tax=Luteimicrobium sp. DT211 TaxID=3393412 RepID=UPI003CEAE900
MTDARQDTTTRVATCVGDLSVRVVGSGPPALLWHSLLVDSSSWTRVEDDLAGRRTLVMVDAPGHGRSACPPRRFGIHDCAAAALDVMDALGLSVVDWLGVAWGGRVGLAFAAAYGERLRSLTTFSAPPFRLSAAWRRVTASLLVPYRLLGPVAPVTEAAMRTVLGERARRTDVEAAILVSRAFLGAGRTGMARTVSNALLHPEDLSGVLARITVPTLVVAGGDDETFTADDAAAVAASMPNARSDVLESVFRLAPLERPHETTKLVLDHWDQSAWA